MTELIGSNKTRQTGRDSNTHVDGTHIEPLPRLRFIQALSLRLLRQIGLRAGSGHARFCGAAIPPAMGRSDANRQCPVREAIVIVLLVVLRAFAPIDEIRVFR